MGTMLEGRQWESWEEIPHGGLDWGARPGVWKGNSSRYGAKLSLAHFCPALQWEESNDADEEAGH